MLISYLKFDRWFNPFDPKGNYSSTSNNTKLVHWPLMGGLYIWYSEEGPERAVPNVTNSPAIYDGPLLCGFNVAIKWLNFRSSHPSWWIFDCDVQLFDITSRRKATVMELHIPPLHALINFFLEFNSWLWHAVITAYFLSISPFRQSYYFITPRGLDLTHSRGHSSRRTTFA